MEIFIFKAADICWTKTLPTTNSTSNVTSNSVVLEKKTIKYNSCHSIGTRELGN